MIPFQQVNGSITKYLALSEECTDGGCHGIT